MQPLLRDTLGQDHVEELASLLVENTGQPLFTRQTLLSIHERGLMAYDPLRAAWVWNSSGILRNACHRQCGCTDGRKAGCVLADDTLGGHANGEVCWERPFRFLHFST
ncbi:MAG: hypothetical protein R3B47_08405 [Bacteroidia bacterium]